MNVSKPYASKAGKPKKQREFRRIVSRSPLPKSPRVQRLYSTANAGTTLSGPLLQLQTTANSSGGSTKVEVAIPSEFRSSWVRSTVNTPGYNRNMRKEKVIPGVRLPMNPFGFFKTRSSGRFGTRTEWHINRVTGVWTEVQTSGDWGANSNPPQKSTDDSASLKNEALKKLLGKAKDQSVNLGWAVGEGKQTVNLFVQNARKIANSALNLRQGNFAGAAQNLLGISQANYRKRDNLSFQKDLRKNSALALANGWLELQYGWKPLLSDIYGSLEFLANKLYKTPRIKEIAIKSKNRSERGAPYDSLDIHIETTYMTEHTVKYVLYYTQSGNHDLSALGLTNPLSIAWEVMPWSFVVDWALPIGTYLNDLDAFSGLTFDRGCVTEFWRGTTTSVETGKQRVFGDWTYITTSGVKEVWQTVSCSRNVLMGFPSSPLPSFTHPFKGGPFGPHALNALALLTQAFKR